MSTSKLSNEQILKALSGMKKAQPAKQEAPVRVQAAELRKLNNALNWMEA